MFDYNRAGLYAFLVGSLAFTADALMGAPINGVYLAGCLLFDVGCGALLVKKEDSARSAV